MDQGDQKGEGRSAEVLFVSRKKKREKRGGLLSEKRALQVLLRFSQQIYANDRLYRDFNNNDGYCIETENQGNEKYNHSYMQMLHS